MKNLRRTGRYVKRRLNAGEVIHRGYDGNKAHSLKQYDGYYETWFIIFGIGAVCEPDGKHKRLNVKRHDGWYEVSEEVWEEVPSFGEVNVEKAVNGVEPWREHRDRLEDEYWLDRSRNGW